jgi:hydroxymethylbilane synthase
MTHSQTVVIGTRGSTLARWQADHVAALLGAAYPDLAVKIEVITTRGDRVLDTPLPLIGGKGLFTAELEGALREGAVDLAVHSLKDLPTDDPPGLTVGAIPRRAAVHDALVSRGGHTLDSLPPGATVGTSSRRRAAQARHARPDLQVADIRGNVPTRIKKVEDANGPYDATLLAQAGLERLGQADRISEVLPLDRMLPAPGQGALGVQCRDETDSLALLRPINHRPTRQAVAAERAFLAGLGGGCALPIAAYGAIDDGVLRLRGRVSALDGSRQIDVAGEASMNVADPLAAARALGWSLAEQARAQGAMDLLNVDGAG